MEQWDICCEVCNKLIVREQREGEGIASDVKCIYGSYMNGYWDIHEDVFYCIDCAKKKGFKFTD